MPAPREPGPPSLISLDMRVAGDLHSDGEIQVDGIVDGDIRAKSLTVGKTAEVNGEILCEFVRVWGRVNGRIRGQEVALMESAEVHGDVLHRALEIARGARVEGMLKREEQDPAPPEARLELKGDSEDQPSEPVSDLTDVSTT